jgi:hypothetical protein
MCLVFSLLEVYRSEALRVQASHDSNRGSVALCSLVARGSRMRRYPILLLTLGLVLLAGLPTDQPAMAVTIDADTLTFDPASTAHVDHDSLLAAFPAEPWAWTRSRSVPTGDHPSAWSRSRAVLVTVARAPPPAPSA